MVDDGSVTVADLLDPAPHLRGRDCTRTPHAPATSTTTCRPPCSRPAADAPPAVFDSQRDLSRDASAPVTWRELGTAVRAARATWRESLAARSTAQEAPGTLAGAAAFTVALWSHGHDHDHGRQSR